MRQYYCNDCLNCQYQGICAGENRLRVITDYGGVLSKRMALKMETNQGKEEFGKRKQTVEWPFSNIKENLRYTEFLTHGMNGIETEKNLINISHNIKRIYNHNKYKINRQNQLNT